MATITTVTVLLHITAIKNWDFIQLDVQNAFLNGYLDEDIYMHIRQGYKVPNQSSNNLIYKLNRSLYGLKQVYHFIIIMG